MSADEMIAAALLAPFSDDQRAAIIEGLAGDDPDLPGTWWLLARMAHESLTPQRQGELFAIYREAVAKARELADRLLGWEQCYPELTGACGDRQDMAVAMAEADAHDALNVLVNGEKR